MIWFWVLVGCSEYDINAGGETGEEATPQDTSQADTAPAEEDCEVALAAATSVEILKECLAPEVSITDAWEMESEWQWLSASEDGAVDQVVMPPMVGNLTDDNGDGAVTVTDVPDVVFVAFDENDWYDGDWSLDHARLVVLDGSDGTEHWSKSGFYPFGSVAIADINRDGQAEIVAVTAEGTVQALSGSGDVVWTSDRLFAEDYVPDAYEFIVPIVSVADLHGDGNVSVLAFDRLLSGSTGEALYQLSAPDTLYTSSAIGDINLDGKQEIIRGNVCYSADGEVLWTADISGDYGLWPVILNADDDPEGEVAIVGGGELLITDHGGTELFRAEAGNDHPGPPCVADFNGDGAAEIAWSSNNFFTVFDLDGTQRWSRSIIDGSGLLSACSSYDFNGDGAYEILYADQQNFYVFDGASGSTRMSDGMHSSTSIWEYPVIADVDGDNSAELLIASNNFNTDDEKDPLPWSGVTVFGHPEGGWAASGPTWNVHDFAVTNIAADGSVPQVPEPAWQAYNLYRGRPANDAVGIDLIAEITDVCYAGCEPDNTVRVAVQVANQGLDAIREGVPVSLFRVEGASREFIALTHTETDLSPGEAAAGFEFEILASDIGSDGLEVRVDELGAGIDEVPECNEENNADAWNEQECP